MGQIQSTHSHNPPEEQYNGAIGPGFFLVSGAAKMQAFERWLHAAVQRKHPPSAFNAGRLLEIGGDCIERDLVRAKDLYEIAAAAGHLPATTSLAVLLEDGKEGVERDVVRAKDLYETAAAAGYLRATTNLGVLLHNGGEGVERNVVRAKELYETAAAAGYPRATTNLATLLHNGGEGVEPDVVRAKELYETAAAAGDLHATTNLAYLLLNGGEGVERDLLRAKELYETAAAAGDIHATANLGYLLENGGEGFERDLVRAKELYETAAAAGHLRATINLGYLLENGGEGVERDLVRAKELYKTSAESGNVFGIYSLAAFLKTSPETGNQARDVYVKSAKFTRATAMRTPTRPSKPPGMAATEELEKVKKLQTSAKRHQSSEGFQLRAHQFAVGDENTPKNLPEASRCFEEAIKLADNLPDQAKAQTEYARFLVDQDEQTPYLKDKKAIQLLEDALRMYRWDETVSDLIHLYTHSAILQFRNPKRAAELRRISSHILNYSYKDRVVSYLEATGEADKRLLAVMDEVVVRPRSCLLLTLGAPGRGKTATLKSLRGLPFISEYDSTQLTEMSQFVTEPGLYGLDDGMLRELDFRENSLRGIASRLDTRDLRECEKRIKASTDGHDVVQHCANKHRDVLEKVRAGITRLEIESKNSEFARCWDMGGQSEYEMAHSLFIGRADILIFVVNLARVCDDVTRDEEVRNLCYWMQLAHMMVSDPSEVRVIIVGTRKGEVKSEELAIRYLRRTLRLLVAESVDESWVRVKDENRRCVFVAIENSVATEDAIGSGLDRLSKELKRLVQDTLARREEIPLKWLALVDKMRRVQGPKKVLWMRKEVETLCEYFPGFPIERNLRNKELLQGLRRMTTLTGVSSVMLFELGMSEWVVSVSPERMLEMFRRVTSSRMWEDFLRQVDLRRLEDTGTLYESTLKSEIWGAEYEKEEKQAMIELLSECDLLIRLYDGDEPQSRENTLYGVPSLLRSPESLSKVKGENEIVIEAATKFDDGLPVGLQGGLMAHLSRTIHQGIQKVSMIGPSATRLVLEQGRVIVEYKASQREILWTGYSVQSPLDMVRECVTRMEHFLNHHAHRVRVHHRTVFRKRCETCDTSNGLEIDLNLLQTTDLELSCSHCSVVTSLPEYCKGMATSSWNESVASSVTESLFLPEFLFQDISVRMKAACEYFGEDTLREACKGLSRILYLRNSSNLEEFKRELENTDPRACQANYKNCWNEKIACFAISYRQYDAKKGRFKFSDEQWLILKGVLEEIRKCGVTECRIWLDQCLWIRDADLEGCWAECGLFPYLLWPVISLGHRRHDSDRTTVTYERMWPFVEEVLGLWSLGVITSSVQRGPRKEDGCRKWVTRKLRRSLRPEQSMKLLLLNIYHGGTKGLESGWQDDVDELEAMAKWNVESGIETLMVGPKWRRAIAQEARFNKVSKSFSGILNAMILERSDQHEREGTFLDASMACDQKGELEWARAWTSGHCGEHSMNESFDERDTLIGNLVKIKLITDCGVFWMLGHERKHSNDGALWLLVAMAEETDDTDDFKEGEVRWTKVVAGLNSSELHRNSLDRHFVKVLREQGPEMAEVDVHKVIVCSSGPESGTDG